MAATTYGTANDRFKRSFGNWFWGALAAAVVCHWVFLVIFPAIGSEDWSRETTELAAIDIPDDIEIPPPPEQIARPATPIVSALDIDPEITIQSTTFEANPIQNLPDLPRNTGTERDLMDAPTYTPMTEAPMITNREEVSRQLQREYPALLRDAGIGGTPIVWFFIDEQGVVQRRQLSTPSEHTALNEAAMKVADIMKFRPAKNRDKVVGVWVEIPIQFQVGR